MQASRRGFLAGLAVPAMFGRNAIARVMKAAEIAGGRAPHDVARDEDYWAEIRRAFERRPHPHSTSTTAASARRKLGDRGDDPRHPLRQRRARPSYVGYLEPRVEPSAASWPASSAAIRGDGDHPERVRGDADLDLRHRPEAGRRGVDDESELRTHAHRLGPAGEARRHRRQADLVPGAADVGRGDRRLLQEGHDAEDEGGRGDARRQPHRPGDARPGDRRPRQESRRPDLHRRRPRLRSDPVPAR